jgi:hypothetical protein
MPNAIAVRDADTLSELPEIDHPDGTFSLTALEPDPFVLMVRTP